MLRRARAIAPGLALLLACSAEEPTPAAVPTAASARVSAPALARIAVGSCAVQVGPHAFWDVIAADAPDLFVFAGDNVYGDLVVEADGSTGMAPGDPGLLKAAYRTLARVEAFQRFRERVPILPIWDDHDFGKNDGGGDYEHKEDSERQFLDFWGIAADDPRARRPGVYHAQSFGPPSRRVQIILLDTRYFRSPLERDADGALVPDPDPAKTLLGEAQWAWLEQRLREPADVRVVVSSIQVLAEGHPFERWATLPLERDRLLRLIAETGASGVVLVSGDRHRGAIYRRETGVPYALYELTSSSLNRPFADPEEKGPHQLEPMYGRENYGMIELDWDARRVLLSLRDLEGETVRRAEVPLGALQPRGGDAPG